MPKRLPFAFIIITVALDAMGIGLIFAVAPDVSQVALQGVLSALMALTMVGAPILFTATFRLFTAETAPLNLPDAPFALSVLILLPALAVFALARSERVAP
ncbi:hypothetical protein [Pseudooceanicola sp.]|uniref:hypothetical protein n=1 Tax=Pseudooceanicola sp. TaxID=1914328 RepID=UPI0026130C67|nr:hypothetical protein [Pseudooceanicola sp.]MDF1855950.1 hypothetical protein [Pseudooceanicola sp.]